MSPAKQAPAAADVIPEGAPPYNFAVLAPTTPGVIGEYTVARPSLDASGMPIFDAADGDVLGPFQVDGAMLDDASLQMEFDPTDRPIPRYAGGTQMGIGTATFDGAEVEVMLTQVLHHKSVWASRDFLLWVTESRIVIRDAKPGVDGSFRVGHVRYSWVWRTGWRPRQGMLAPCEIVFDVSRKSASDDDWEVAWIRLALAFAKTFDSEDLARTVVRRTIAHTLLQPGLPAGAVEKLHEATKDPREPAPTKGEYAMYTNPVSRRFAGSPDW